MRCCSCQRNVAAGVEAAKMIVEYVQDDGTMRLFGYMMSDGPLADASGRMVRGWHHKCYHVARKREARGDAVTGRVLAGTPTGYDVNDLVLTKDDVEALGLTPAQVRDRSTAHLSAALERLRAVAGAIGRGVGDARVQEAFAASERGGPYGHQHTHRLDTYQLAAHLEYAHGLADAKLLRPSTGLQDQHAELHARRAQAQVSADRLADTDDAPAERDWRTQYTADIAGGEHR